MNNEDKNRVDCWTGLSDEEMVERDPVLAKEIIRRRNEFIAKIEKEKKHE